MNLQKILKNVTGNHMVLVTVVAAAVLIYFVNNYSATKGLVTDGMQQYAGQLGVPEEGQAGGWRDPEESPTVPETNHAGGTFAGCCGGQENYQPSQPLGQNEVNSSVSGMKTNMHGLPASCTRQAVIDPAQLLPKDSNNAFSKMNPMGAGDIRDVSLLKAGYHIGVNSVGQSLRNANLQVRSEPPNPQLNVGPWHNSTIGPDFNRRPLEIGCGPF
jgi:hypothetical protein